MENLSRDLHHMTTRLLLLAALALPAGCESDEAKLERLQQEARNAEMMADMAERAIWGTPGNYDSLTLQAREARTKATLARRELERFLR